MKQTSGRFELAATDLSNHLSCERLTQLERKAALGEIKKPEYRDPSLDILKQRGRDHEAAYVKYLTEGAKKIVDLRGQSVEATLQAMKQGVDVIVQAPLSSSPWGGFADILLKTDPPSKLGNWSYEVQDTKLSQNTKATAILQLCLYTDLLSELQGSVPEKMYIVKPGVDFPTEEYRFTQFQSYYGFVKSKLAQTVADKEQLTYPIPVEHCNICNWWKVCDAKRHVDDHLSLVAGIRSLHIVELERQNIKTLEQFAKTTGLAKPERGSKETFMRKQSQAKIQLDGRIQNKLLHQILAVESGRGFDRLPEPNSGDVYFDIEGDAYFENGGLEYLLGYAYREKGNLIYQRLWSTNRTEEKLAFEKFMAFITERWNRFSDMYIYHFAPYEPTALKRLAHTHATCENELHKLLRGERFIDLYAVFKEALLASVEGYSLKELEKFTTYDRKVDLHDASAARKLVEVALEKGDFQSCSKETIQATELYNEDDCLATESLHGWLEGLRSELVRGGKQFQRPEMKTGEASEDVQQVNTWAQALFKALTKELPEDRSTWSDEQKAKWLLAHQIEYFAREDKSAWWEFFRVHELAHEDLLDERKAITGLEFIKALPKQGRERNPTHRYKYPPQEISINEGDVVIEVKGENIGKVISISLEDQTVDIRKSAKAMDRHPFAIHVSERVDPGALATSLMKLAAEIDDSDLEHSPPFRASKDLLMKRSPQLINGKGAHLLPGEEPLDAAKRIALNLDKSILAIQGPPGSGKTYTGASMIIALVQQGKKIGITAVSHKAIRTISIATLDLAKEQKVKINFVHKVKDKSDDVPDEIMEVEDADDARAALSAGWVACGTAWLWAEDESVGVLDYLFVDEAGQMSLSQVLAASRAAKNIIMLGDPQQLEQPRKGSHPEGSDVAALTYLLDGHLTMPTGKGLFLGVTRRLHPAICKFTSELYYEGRLTSLPGLENQMISGGTPFDGAGLFYVPVEHRGCQNRSLEEIETVAKVVKKLLSGGQWTNSKGERRALDKDDILIVAPYNAQVTSLLEKLPEMRIGTVDKFQGQEAPIVIYSMTSSSIDDAPKGISFIFNPNRMNVATSRAKAVCIMVASPKLLEAECKSIDQMRWANAICSFVQDAKSVKI